jgi:hypothetical protein
MKIEELLTMSQLELYNIILKRAKGLDIKHEYGKYIIINYTSNTPLLCSHLDTVNKEVTLRHNDFISNEGTIRLSKLSKARCLGGDDRCGVYIMMRLIEDMKSDKIARDRYSFGFFFDEEIGGIGSTFYTKTEHFKQSSYSCFIGLDRRNHIQGVPEVALYGFDNELLIDIFKEEGYVEAMGSFTDSSNLSSTCDIACINLSVGYNNEHTPNEYINISDMLHTYYVLRDSSLQFDDMYDYVETNYMYEDWISYKKAENHIGEPLVCDYCGAHEQLYTVYDYCVGEEVVVCESCYKQLEEDYPDGDYPDSAFVELYDNTTDKLVDIEIQPKDYYEK